MSRYRELLEAWRRGEGDLAPVTGFLAMRLERWQPGVAVVSMRVDHRHHNPQGSVHGGIYGDLADCAFGCALASTLDDGETFTSLDLSLRFLRALEEGTLRASAEVLRRGRRTAVLSARLTDGADRLVAVASSSCLIVSEEA